MLKAALITNLCSERLLRFTMKRIFISEQDGRKRENTRVNLDKL
mgnify:CR=1 FL=1